MRKQESGTHVTATVFRRLKNQLPVDEQTVEFPHPVKEKLARLAGNLGILDEQICV